VVHFDSLVEALDSVEAFDGVPLESLSSSALASAFRRLESLSSRPVSTADSAVRSSMMLF